MLFIPLFVLLASNWYFTCRHTYEQTLLEELSLLGISGGRVLGPGLIRVPEQNGLIDLDPTYALQVLPHAVTVSGVSVRELARNAQHAVGLDGDKPAADQTILKSPRGSLAIHCLVPGMLKGNPKPKMARRSELIQEKVSSWLRKRFAFARPANKTSQEAPSERWLFQLFLLEPEQIIVSLAKCKIPNVGGTWPCWTNPAGLAQVDIKENMPSSAYRKLLEALACMETSPKASDRVVDLGACPGGWTAAMLRYGCSVTAVDRSPLERSLMKDPKVTFVKGDAFSFQPQQPVDWMVSDVIAYPERVKELIDRWCGGIWACRLVITMKFQGDVDWTALQEAKVQASELGYSVRSKHFFNNKNEVILCLARI